jgi:hypothetical protein
VLRAHLHRCRHSPTHIRPWAQEFVTPLGYNLIGGEESEWTRRHGSRYEATCTICPAQHCTPAAYTHSLSHSHSALSHSHSAHALRGLSAMPLLCPVTHHCSHTQTNPHSRLQPIPVVCWSSVGGSHEPACQHVRVVRGPKVKVSQVGSWDSVRCE